MTSTDMAAAATSPAATSPAAISPAAISPADPTAADPTPADPNPADPAPDVRPAGGPAPLARSRDDRWIAGVCGGLAAHLDIDVTLLRILTVVLAVVGNMITVALYLAFWVIMPEGAVSTRNQ